MDGDERRLSGNIKFLEELNSRIAAFVERRDAIESENSSILARRPELESRKIEFTLSAKERLDPKARENIRKRLVAMREGQVQ